MNEMLERHHQLYIKTVSWSRCHKETAAKLKGEIVVERLGPTVAAASMQLHPEDHQLYIKTVSIEPAVAGVPRPQEKSLGSTAHEPAPLCWPPEVDTLARCCSYVIDNTEGNIGEPGRIRTYNQRIMRAFYAPVHRSCKEVNAEAWNRKRADISRLSSTFHLFPFTHERAQVRIKYKVQVPPELPPALNRNCSAEHAFIPTTTRHAGATNTDTALIGHSVLR